MVQIKITDTAKKDIASIYKFIKRESPQNAIMVSESIIKKIDSFYNKADIGKIVKEFNNAKIREIKLYKFRIIYLLNSSISIEIITIHHSSRLLENNPHLKNLFG